MRQADKKYFGDVQQGRLNADDSPFVVGTNEWVNAENIRTGSTDKGFTGIVESVGGNAELPEPLPLYEEVKIGDQIWMTKNWDSSYYSNGLSIRKVTNLVDFNNATSPVWCYPNFNDANAEYGKLYNSVAIYYLNFNPPIGWRVPTPSDFQQLKSYIGNDGDKLKESGTTHWDSPNTGTNQTGFLAYGAGSTDIGTFRNRAIFWADDSQTIYYLTNSSNVFDLDQANQGAGYSVRLIKSNTQVPKQYITIGSVEDTENKRLIHFDCDISSNRLDRIVCLYTNTNTSYILLNSDQVISDKYLYSNLYVFSNTIFDNTKTNNISVSASFVASSQTINISGAFSSTFAIGDSIIISNTLNNNGVYIISNISVSSLNTAITVTQNIVNETTVSCYLTYANQIVFSQRASLSNLFIGYKIVITNNPAINGTYYIQSINTSNNSVTILPNLTSACISFVASQIDVYSSIPLYSLNGLNFSKDSLIHSAKISNGNILSWVDGTNNEPRKINIESAIKANYPSFNTDQEPYIFPLNFSEITLIKRPPIYTPNISKYIDSSFSNNFIYNNSFEFGFQYEYYDSEVSVISSYSQASLLNTPTDNSNAISVSMDLREHIPSVVKKINLIARISDGTLQGGNYSVVVKTWNKSIPNELLEIENHNNRLSSSSLSYIFYYDTISNTIPSDDTLRAFDNVPIFSQAHEVSKSRYFLGNNTLGYDTPATTSLTVSLGNQLNTNTSALSQTFNIYQIKSGWAYTDWFYGPSVDWSRAGYYIYINSTNVRTGWYLINGTQVSYDTTYSGYLEDANPAALPASTSILTGLTYAGDSIAAIVEGRIIFPQQNPAYNLWFQEIPSQIVGSGYTTQDTIEITGLANVSYNALAQNSSYNLGIVFYDYAMRKCGVCDKGNKTNNILSGIDWGFDSTTSSYFFVLNAQVAVPLNGGQQITISGLPNSNGTYIVSASYTRGTDWIIIVRGSISPFTASPGTLSYTIINITLNTPYRDYNYNSAYQNGAWQLDNANAINEIPEWAYYYSIVSTLNLRTRFFLQSLSTELKYAQKDSNGNYTYISQFPGIQLVAAVAVNVAALSYSGLGYLYEAANNDICILWSDNGVDKYELPVIGQDGNYILLKPYNIANDLSNKKFAYEVYTPHKKDTNEVYYEIGEIYTVTNPKTSIRSYETTSGIINPDTFIFTRAYLNNTYTVSAMSPNDLYWKIWNSNAGKSNNVITIGQKVNNTNISWSDTYISGTQINGSSTFRLGNETFVSDDCGSITKLQLTSKVQDQGQGSVMLALCNSEINSIYLGETQITDSTGKTQFFSASQNVISTINILKGNYGCISPESVVQYRGKVYFVDLSNGRVVQYSDNGLDAISNVKMSKFWKNWSYQYLNMNTSLSKVNVSSIVSITNSASNDIASIEFNSNGVVNPNITINIYLNSIGVAPILIATYTTIGGESLLDIISQLIVSINTLNSPVYNVYSSRGQLNFTFSNTTYSFGGIMITSNPIEALGDRPYIFSMVDSGHDELLISLPKLSNTPPKGYLPDYTTTVYPFDILDYQGKTIVYCLGTAAQIYPHWQGAYTFTTENFVSLQNRLFSFKNGLIYEHNQDVQNTFYTVYTPSSIMFTSNILGQVPKVYDNFVAESNLMPSFVYFYNNYPYIQTSDLDDTSFVDLEGIWYANILRNKIVPTATGFTTDGLLTAEVMRNTNMYVQATFSPTTEPLELRLIQLGTSISKGHIIT
jgi:uncharacterized protein (TIGR02145 family)